MALYTVAASQAIASADINQFTNLLAGLTTDSAMALNTGASHNVPVLISRTTLTGYSGGFQFSSIPQTFQHLLMVMSTKCDAGGGATFADVGGYLNGLVGGANQYGDETLDLPTRTTSGGVTISGSSNMNANQWAWMGGLTAANPTITGPGCSVVWFPNYTSSYCKGYLTHSYFGDWGTLAMRLRCGGSTVVGPITRINLTLPANFVTGSKFALYGMP